jgi:hypothetical protein
LILAELTARESVSPERIGVALADTTSGWHYVEVLIHDDDDAPVFGVLDSVRGELADSLTYAQAVKELNLICDDYASEGWTVEHGWASSGNYSAAKLTNTIEGRPHERFLSVERDDL